MFEERNVKQFYCSKCKKRISRSNKKAHLKKYHLHSSAQIIIPSPAQLKWFNLYLHRLSNLIHEEFAIIAPQIKVNSFDGSTLLKVDVILHQSLETIVPNIFFSKQIAAPLRRNQKVSYFEQNLRNSQEQIYCKWKGKSLLNKNVLNLFKSSFKCKIRNQPFIWSGVKNTFFGVHKDASDELVLNYVVFGVKKWWIIKKDKEKRFKQIVINLLSLETKQDDHILEHERIWIDGDWLSRQYPQLEIIQIIQRQNQFVLLTNSDIYHWGINIEPTLTEINILKRGKEINHDKKCSF